MATLQQSIVALNFLNGDLPASAGSYSPMTPAGAVDGVDFSCIPMPCTGTIVGVAVVGAPASGDTVAVQPTIGSGKTFGSNTAVASLTTTISNAAPSASSVVSKDQSDAQFIAGQYIGVQYETTTGGVYTARDLLVTLYISTGRTDI